MIFFHLKLLKLRRVKALLRLVKKNIEKSNKQIDEKMNVTM